MSKTGIYWFRKALRLHDNDALLKATQECDILYPVFFLDPAFTDDKKMEIDNGLAPSKLKGTGIDKPCANVFQFFFETMDDLNKSLKKLSSQLIVFRGNPRELFPIIFKEWNVNCLYFENDTEPYSLDRDNIVTNICQKNGIKIYDSFGHTLYDPKYLLTKYNQVPPKTYKAFCNLLDKCSDPIKPIKPIDSIPKMDVNKVKKVGKLLENKFNIKQYGFKVPNIIEIGYKKENIGNIPIKGGESNALKMLAKHVKNTKFICDFSKPKTSPNSLKPSTTMLSPYITNGSLSVRLFWHEINNVIKGRSHTMPPTSLHGQLYFREWFYLLSSVTPNFHQMLDNPICRQIPWDKYDSDKVYKWEYSQTGYPFIDALMTQLRETGWMHHLGRHAVACFFTRGDMWQHWEVGRDIFHKYLLDGDYALNSANWMWLSASAFFSAYFRVYSPISFGKKTDSNGDFIRKWVPLLKNYDKKYIYEPWKAPIKDQRKWGCIIGKDYPKPMLNHDDCKTKNMAKMKAAFQKNKNNNQNNSSKKRNITQYFNNNNKIYKIKNKKRRTQ